MAIIGAVVTLSAMGMVGREVLTSPVPATLSARIVDVRSTASGQVAVIRVVNDGDRTAAGVSIEGVAAGQTATATLDYVPGRGHATAYLPFKTGAQTAEVSVKGWSAP